MKRRITNLLSLLSILLISLMSYFVGVYIGSLITSSFGLNDNLIITAIIVLSLGFGLGYLGYKLSKLLI
jgi:hypothetical protein